MPPLQGANNKDADNSSNDDDDVDLTKTKYDDAWLAFTAVMFVTWAVVMLVTCFVLWSDQRRRKKRDQSALPGRLLRQSVLSINACVCGLRLAYFVDPRGWEGKYDSLVFELLLRTAQCLMMAQWLLVILRWRDLEMFTGSQGLGLMINWTPQRWQRITLAVIGLLTTLIVGLTALSEAGIAEAELSDAANWVLGVYSCLFVFVGSFVGYRASRALFHNVRGNQARKASRRDAEPPATSAKEQHARQIVNSLAFATPATFLLVAVYVWRGNAILSPGEFFAYLVVRYTSEVVMCVTVLYAVRVTIETPVVILSALSDRLSKRVTRALHAVAPSGRLSREPSSNPPPAEPKAPMNNNNNNDADSGKDARPAAAVAV